jgi:hypothetical protein
VTVEAIAEVMDDLQTAYGSVPTPAMRLRQCRELAATVKHLGVRTIVRREGDLVFMGTRSRPLLAALQSLPGRVRSVGKPSEDGIGEVWWRPPTSRLSLSNVLADLSSVLAARV